MAGRRKAVPPLDVASNGLGSGAARHSASAGNTPTAMPGGGRNKSDPFMRGPLASSGPKYVHAGNSTGYAHT